MVYTNKNGGGCGIRTHGRDKPTLVFKTSTFDHSVNPPRREIILVLWIQNNSKVETKLFFLLGFALLN